MDNTLIIHPQEKPNHWLLMSTLLFIGFFVVGLTAMTLLNGGIVNHMLFPVGTDIAMFQLIWQEQPLRALEFIVTKSLFVFIHQDPRSGLNLWTLQYDSITLVVYLFAALLGGQLISRARQTVRHNTGLLRGLLGVVLLVTAFTYMTAIEHCSGATWVGFVAFYGLGFSDFEFYPYYQGTLSLLSLGLLTWGFIKQAQANR
ncbi:MAG: hypothetical protein L3J84_12785 [Gammaproteobacteria bacterium]|nr:hypothetical protein [Gammaproteobacteria bacterium]